METSEAVQKSEHLRRENERMKILTADLASQVWEIWRLYKYDEKYNFKIKPLVNHMNCWSQNKTKLLYYQTLLFRNNFYLVLSASPTYGFFTRSTCLRTQKLFENVPAKCLRATCKITTWLAISHELL